MTVSAVVVSHGHAAELERSLPGARCRRSTSSSSSPTCRLGRRRSPHGVRVIENPRPLPLAANVNLGVAATAASSSSSPTRTRSPEPDAVAVLAAFMDAHPRCGIAGPQMLWPDGTWQPSRRALPDRRAARSCGGRRCGSSSAPYERQRDHYLLDERPDRARRRPTGCSAPSCSSGARCSRSSAAGMPATGTTSRTSTSATGRCEPAGSGGTCPPRSSRHDYAAVIDRRFLSRHTLWHLRGMARFVRKHPEAIVSVVGART